MANNVEVWQERRRVQLQEREARAAVEFKVAAGLLRTYVNGEQPDLVVIGGNSSIISETALNGTPRIPSGKLMKFSPDLNKSLYGDYYTFDIEGTGVLLDKYFPNIDRSGKLMMIDDRAVNGEKARRSLIMLRELGFKDPKYAVLVANPETKSEYLTESGMFIASRNADLYTEVDWLARGISVVNRDLVAEKSATERKKLQELLLVDLGTLKRLAR